MNRASSDSISGDDTSVTFSNTHVAASSMSIRCRAKEGRRTGHLVPPLKIDLSNCKYELLRIVAHQLGWQVVDGATTSDWDLYWTDTSISQERLINLRPTQRINHFYGMLEICRKHSMAQRLAALAAVLPPNLSYNFFPNTWQLPGQLSSFLAAAKAAGKKQAFIVKPDAGCQGKGIKLVQGGSEATVLRNLAGLATVQAVAQQYINQPFLINGLKFDLRVYVLVTDVSPLRVFIFKEGLVRFCTTPYKKPTSKNINCAYMHLTNYAVNKTNAEAFVAPAGRGHQQCQQTGLVHEGLLSGVDHHGCSVDSAASKWTFAQLRSHLEVQGHSWSRLWSSIGQLVVKSLLSVAPHLAAMYRTTVVDTAGPSATPSPPAAAAGMMDAPISSSSSSSSSKGPAVTAAALAAGSCRCFEILGFDVLLDADVNPWLIEINHSPSFNIDSPLDKTIKEQLIMDAIKLVRIDAVSIAAAKKAAKKATQMRLLTPSMSRNSSNMSAAASGLGDWSGSYGGSTDCRAAQQDCSYRDALIAARDRWQMKHLGGFERLYPVPIPAQPTTAAAAVQQQQNHPSIMAERTVCSTSNNQTFVSNVDRIAAAQEQQDIYDQILKVSQQLYHGQHQQKSGVQQLRNKSVSLSSNSKNNGVGGLTTPNCMKASSVPDNTSGRSGHSEAGLCASSPAVGSCAKKCGAAGITGSERIELNHSCSMCKRSSSSSSGGSSASGDSCRSSSSSNALSSGDASRSAKAVVTTTSSSRYSPARACVEPLAVSSSGSSSSTVVVPVAVQHHAATVVESSSSTVGDHEAGSNASTTSLLNATAALAALSAALAEPDTPPPVSKPRIRALSANASSSSSRTGSSALWTDSSSSSSKKVLSRPATASSGQRSLGMNPAPAQYSVVYHDRVQGGSSSSSSSSSHYGKLTRSLSAPRCRSSCPQQQQPPLLLPHHQHPLGLSTSGGSVKVGCAGNLLKSATGGLVQQQQQQQQIEQAVAAASNSTALFRRQSAPGLHRTADSRSCSVSNTKLFGTCIVDDTASSCADAALFREPRALPAAAAVPLKSARGLVAWNATALNSTYSRRGAGHDRTGDHADQLDDEVGAVQHKHSIAAAVAEATAALGAAVSSTTGNSRDVSCAVRQQDMLPNTSSSSMQQQQQQWHASIHSNGRHARCSPVQQHWQGSSSSSSKKPCRSTGKACKPSPTLSQKFNTPEVILGQLQDMTCRGTNYLTTLGSSRATQDDSRVIQANGLCAAGAVASIRVPKLQLPLQAAYGSMVQTAPGSVQKGFQSGANQHANSSSGVVAIHNGAITGQSGGRSRDDLMTSSGDSSAAAAAAVSDSRLADRATAMGQSTSGRPMLRCGSFGLLGRLRLQGA